MIIKMLIYFHLRPTSGETSTEKNFQKFFIVQKVSFWNLRGSLLSYFWAITLISAVVAILEPFGTSVPGFIATVKQNQFRLYKFYESYGTMRTHEMNPIWCFIRYKYYRSEKLDIIISSETRNLK